MEPLDLDAMALRRFAGWDTAISSSSSQVFGRLPMRRAAAARKKLAGHLCVSVAHTVKGPGDRLVVIELRLADQAQ